MDETEIADDLSKQDEDCKASVLEDCTLPDACALLHVTNRRKVLPRKKCSFVVCTMPFCVNVLVLILHPNMYYSFRRTANYWNCKQNMRICF